MSKFEYVSIDYSTAGNVLANNHLNRYFINSGFRKNAELMEYVEMTKKGSVVFKAGSGRYNLLLVGGVHGDELASQAALIRLMHNIIQGNMKIKCRLHIVPFLIPYAQNNNITALCDCHTTDPDKKPGFASVFCSARPLFDSIKIAKHICIDTSSRILPISDAGSILKGAVEDESNLRGIPSVTCEAVSPSGNLYEDSVDFSYMQICSFLDYFGVI